MAIGGLGVGLDREKPAQGVGHGREQLPGGWALIVNNSPEG